MSKLYAATAEYVVHAIRGDLPARRVLIRGFPAEACCARPRLAEPGSFIATIPGFRYAETPTEVQPGESVVVVRQRWNIDEKSVRKHVADGCVVGSAIVKDIGEGRPVAEVLAKVKALADGAHSA